MKKVLLIVLSLFLFQTSTFAIGVKSTMNKVMDSWNGEHIDSVIDNWGYPSNEKTVAGRNLYIWDNGTALTENKWGTVLLEQQSCTRIFEVDKNNTIVKWQWKGVDCPATYCTSKKWVNPNNNPWRKK